MNELDQCVIDLHDIARKLETKFLSAGQLSEDIRRCADRLNDVIKEEVNDY